MKPLYVLLATNRPAVRAFFLSLELQGPCAITVAQLPLRVEAPGTSLVPQTGSVIAAVDIAIGPAEASELCRVLRARRSDLPLLGLICCPYSATPWQMRALADAGIGSWLDLEATPDELLSALRRVASGAMVMRVQLSRDHIQRSGPLSVANAARSGLIYPHYPTLSGRLLTLVTRGLSDAEMGQQLHLSQHTVKHHLDRLREELGVRNRLELAAWAGRHGLYCPESPIADADREGVQAAHWRQDTSRAQGI